MAQAPPTQVDHPRGESCHGDPNLPPRLHKCAKTASLLLVESQIALVHRSSNTHQLLSLAIINMPLIHKMVKHTNIKMNIGSMGKTIKGVFDDEKIENVTILDKF